MLIIFGAAHALPPAPPLQVRFTPTPVNETELCFPSGFKAHLVERSGSEVATLSMVIDAGSSSESREERSAAHLIEHLWFRARPGAGPDVETLGIGLAQSAYTQPDVTSYVTVGSAGDLPALLSLEAQRLIDPLVGITPAEVESEKRIVSDELLMRNAHGARTARTHLARMLYPVAHPYHAPAATQADVAKLDLETLKAFAAREYVPAGTTLSIESGLTLDAMQHAVSEAFGAALEGTGVSCAHARSTEAPPQPSRTRIDTHEAPVRQRAVYMGWTLPAGYGDDRLAQAMAVAQLESVVWNRLPWVTGLKADQNDTELGCTYHPGRLASEAICLVRVQERIAADQLIAAIHESLPRQWTISDADQARRARVTNNLASAHLDHLLTSADSVQEDAVDARGLQRHAMEGPSTLKADIEATLKLRGNQLAEVARQWLTPERVVVFVVEPGTAPASTGSIPTKARLDIEAIPPWTPATVQFDFTHKTLPNGLKIVRSYRGLAPLTRTVLSRFGGLELTQPGADVAWDSSQVYKSMPGVSLQEVRRRTGSIAWDTATWGAAAVHGRAGGGSPGLALWQTRVWLDNVVMDTGMLQQQVDRRLENLEPKLTRTPFQHTGPARMQHLYPNAAVAMPWWRSTAAARRVGEGTVLKWRRMLNVPSRSTLVMVTPDPSSLAQAEKYLGGWKGKKATPVARKPLPPAPNRRAVNAFAWDTVVADVRISCRLPGRTANNDAALDVLEALTFRSLWQTLREDGGSYAPKVFVDPWSPQSSLLGMQVQVPPDQAQNAVLASFSAVERASTPSALALDAARLDVLGDFARNHESTSGHFAQLAQAVELDLPIEALANYPERVKAVTPGQLKALLVDCQGKESVTVVGANQGSLVDLAPTWIDWEARGKKEAKAVR